MRGKLVELAERLVERWLATPDYKTGTLEGVGRILDLASLLGRRACEQAADRKEVTGADGGPIRVEFEAALKRIYGEKPAAAVVSAPAPVVDVEAVPAGPAVEAGGAQ
jgi:hypothetical protein